VAGWSKNSGDFGQRLRHRLCNATPSEGGGLHRGGLCRGPTRSGTPTRTRERLIRRTDHRMLRGAPGR
jgi:hypothetical protein